MKLLHNNIPWNVRIAGKTVHRKAVMIPQPGYIFCVQSLNYIVWASQKLVDGSEKFLMYICVQVNRTVFRYGGGGETDMESNALCTYNVINMYAVYIDRCTTIEEKVYVRPFRSRFLFLLLWQYFSNCGPGAVERKTFSFLTYYYNNMAVGNIIVNVDDIIFIIIILSYHLSLKHAPTTVYDSNTVGISYYLYVCFYFQTDAI